MLRRVEKLALVAGVAGGVYALANIFHPTVVLGNSMAPTLKHGRLIWTDRTWYRTHQPQRGEVVVFRQDGETYIKRIYRGPGENVCFVANHGQLVSVLRESRAEYYRERCRRSTIGLEIVKMQVPSDAVFVMGDNYRDSVDSRELGCIPVSHILGRVHMEPDVRKLSEYELAPAAPAQLTNHAPSRPDASKAASSLS